MDENGKLKLWKDYSNNPTPQLREKLILEYAPLVKLVAGRLSMYLGYNVEYLKHTHPSGSEVRFLIRSEKWTGFPEQSVSDKNKYLMR